MKMRQHTRLLVSLVMLMDRFPWPPRPARRPKGGPITDSDRLILKALTIMIIRRVYTVYALLAFLAQDDPVAQQLRPLLHQHGRFASPRRFFPALYAGPGDSAL
jgi:hypothetical protein